MAATIRKNVRQVYLFAFEENGVEVIMCWTQGDLETPFLYLGAGGEESVAKARALAQDYANHYGFPVKVIGFGQRRVVATVDPIESEAFPEAFPANKGEENAPVQ